MKLPGFTADVSLYSTRGYRQRAGRAAGRAGGREVVSQLGGRTFGGFGGGGLFGFGDYYWACRYACDTAHTACLNGCEGTWESPKGSTNCIICDQDYQRCLGGC